MALVGDDDDVGRLFARAPDRQYRPLFSHPEGRGSPSLRPCDAGRPVWNDSVLHLARVSDPDCSFCDRVCRPSGFLPVWGHIPFRRAPSVYASRRFLRHPGRSPEPSRKEAPPFRRGPSRHRPIHSRVGCTGCRVPLFNKVEDGPKNYRRGSDRSDPLPCLHLRVDLLGCLGYGALGKF